MTFGFTRDSALLWLGFVSVVGTYFLAAEQTPDQWSFRDWTQFVIMVVGWGIGKLQTSPLSHSTEPPTR
jgi:hypothetical protein